jgi:hypothetical protein
LGINSSDSRDALRIGVVLARRGNWSLEDGTDDDLDFALGVVMCEGSLGLSRGLETGERLLGSTTAEG